MPHGTPLISTIVAALVLAFILGALANRFHVSPLVGYLVAGVLIGPFTPGYVADQGVAKDLAKIGIILLMFGVGLHFTLQDRLSVRAIAIPGAFESGQVVAQARAINPALPIIARSHSDEETVHFQMHGANKVIMGEEEIGLAMLAEMSKL